MRKNARFAIVALLVAAPVSADTLIVGNKYEHTVSFVDLLTGSEVARRETGRAPHEIAVSPDGKTAVLVSYREQGFTGNSLTIFDVGTATKVGTIDLGEHRGPHGLKWIAGTNKVVATTEVSEEVVIVDISKRVVVGAISTGARGSHMVALSPDLSRAFVANIGSGSFSVLDLASGKEIAEIASGAGTEGITVSPDGSEIWVGANQDKTVTIFDSVTLKPKARIDLQSSPIRVEFSPDGKHVAVSEFDQNRVAIFDSAGRARIATIDLGALNLEAPVTLLFAPDGSRLWAAATHSATIVEIDTNGWDIRRIIGVGEGSDGIAYSPETVNARSDQTAASRCTGGYLPFARQSLSALASHLIA